MLVSTLLADMYVSLQPKDFLRTSTAQSFYGQVQDHTMLQFLWLRSPLFVIVLHEEDGKAEAGGRHMSDTFWLSI